MVYYNPLYNPTNQGFFIAHLTTFARPLRHVNRRSFEYSSTYGYDVGTSQALNVLESIGLVTSFKTNINTIHHFVLECWSLHHWNLLLNQQNREVSPFSFWKEPRIHCLVVLIILSHREVSSGAIIQGFMVNWSFEPQVIWLIVVTDDFAYLLFKESDLLLSKLSKLHQVQPILRLLVSDCQPFRVFLQPPHPPRFYPTEGIHKHCRLVHHAST